MTSATSAEVTALHACISSLQASAGFKLPGMHASADFCRLYALVRMVEVVLTNLQRIDQLWPIFLSHVMELLGHAKTSIRNAAVDALAKAVVGALSHVNAVADADTDKVRHLGNSHPLLPCQRMTVAKSEDDCCPVRG